MAHDTAGARSRFVLSTSCELPPRANPDCVKWFMEAAREYAAGSAFSAPEPGRDEEETMATVTVHGGASGLTQELLIGRHRAIADEPIADGGADTGPSPYDYLLMALGA